MVITSRHHDGFSMYDTALSDYKVTNTPFKRDPLAELANACAKRRDVKLGFYSSLLDWHHPAYRFRAESGLAWSDYLAFLHGQVRELCTNFGEIACIWFDGDWPHHPFSEKDQYFKPGGSFEYETLFDMIHTLQPDAVVHNNRHEKPLPGEDVQGFEQDLPGANTAGFNSSKVYDMALEVCMTLNQNWGYHPEDEDHKSTRQLIHYLVRSASGGANYLLNVGPSPLGEIVPVHAQRLQEVGQWLSVNGESIYGTRAGKVLPTADMVSTCNGDTHYIHLLNYVSDCVKLKGFAGNTHEARLLHTGAPVKSSTKGDSLVLTIPPSARSSFDTVIKLSPLS
jgi:alpha-L-fucosidase